MCDPGALLAAATPGASCPFVTSVCCLALPLGAEQDAGGARLSPWAAWTAWGRAPWLRVRARGLGRDHRLLLVSGSLLRVWTWLASWGHSSHFPSGWVTSGLPVCSGPGAAAHGCAAECLEHSFTGWARRGQSVVSCSHPTPGPMPSAPDVPWDWPSRPGICHGRRGVYRLEAQGADETLFSPDSGPSFLISLE